MPLCSTGQQGTRIHGRTIRCARRSEREVHGLLVDNEFLEGERHRSVRRIRLEKACTPVSPCFPFYPDFHSKSNCPSGFAATAAIAICRRELPWLAARVWSLGGSSIDGDHRLKRDWSCAMMPTRKPLCRLRSAVNSFRHRTSGRQTRDDSGQVAQLVEHRTENSEI